MLNPTERECWYQEYLRAGMELADASEVSQVQAWARSMSLVAEQFMDSDERDEAEPELV